MANMGYRWYSNIQQTYLSHLHRHWIPFKMSNSKYSSQLRKLHRHITAHDSSGKSIYISSPTLQHHPGPQHVAARTYAVMGFPVELDGDNDIQAYTSGSDLPESMYNHNNVVLPGGTTCNSVEIAPGGTSPMHQTVSFDIAICTDGQMVCELDSGEKVTLYPGVCWISSSLTT